MESIVADAKNPLPLKRISNVNTQVAVRSDLFTGREQRKRALWAEYSYHGIPSPATALDGCQKETAFEGT
jgi:hypothetical protein